MVPVLGLLPSPLLGPSVWRPVAEDLSRRGWDLVMPGPFNAAPRTPDDVLRWFLAALPADRDVVLVPHSNAGLYVPALTARRRIAGYVFVDAGLPAGTGSVPLAPVALHDHLRQLADADGLLPPWTQWWEEADVAPLFPDATTRTAVEQEQRRLPLSYFTASLPVSAGWDHRPGAYLAFGGTYAEERRRAADHGWPTVTVPGGHLHTLMSPEDVGAQIDVLLSAIGFRP